MSATSYYPEFDSAEVAETITPLAEHDDAVLAVLHGTRPAFVQRWLDAEEQYPFQLVVRSVAVRLIDGDPLAGHTDLLADPEAILLELLSRTESRLREVYGRPLVAAINIARKNGRLAGATAHDRYRAFIDQASRSSFEGVSGLDFPVLRDVTRLVLRNERDAFRELAHRLRRDRAAIQEKFGIAADDRLMSLGLGEGDTHHHGRSVSVLVFASGERLVYKPRDVSCEAAYVTIARELNVRLGTSLVSAGVLEREGYGYVEFVETEDVSDMAAAFMRASGELAAVLYLLNARDMHFENILPTRRGPLPIDLETILHPERVHSGPTPEAPGNAYATISRSVYGIGILPLVMAGKEADAGHVDLGFLGGSGQGSSPFKSMQYEHPYTDHIRVVFAATPAAERTAVVNALTEDETYQLGAEMAEGFTRVFRAASADLDGWTGLLRKAVSGVRVRYVHNPTALYSQTLRMTSAPAALDGTAPYLALLKRIAIASKTSAQPVVVAELRQLAERDIPYFTVSSTSTALTDGDGDEIGAEVACSPLDAALEKASRLSEFELAEQLRLIHSAFASRFPDNHLAGATVDTPRPGAVRAGTGELEALVMRLSDHLVATSLPDRFAHLPRTWIGPLASAEASRPWPPGVLGYELYTGRTGPALALAAAGRLMNHRAYLDLATQIFSTTAGILADRRYENRSLRAAGYGGYTGMAGILFGLATAGRLLEKDEWLRAAQDAVPLVQEQIGEQPPDRLPLDVISGLSGVLSCVIAIGGPSAGETVTALTTMLLDGLRADGAAQRSLFAQSGFAHGISGTLHALSRAYPLLPAELRGPVRAAQSSLLQRLDGFFDPAEQNWFSNLATPQSFSTGWCHGAAGIALAFAEYATASGDAEVIRLRDLAVENTLRDGFGRNLTWCHGDLGNHDILSGLAEAGGSALRTRLAAVEDEWLQPSVIIRKNADTRSRYAHTSSMMVGSAGLVLHLVNRLDPTTRLSPVALTLGGR
ncbi:type 2 lanthipeptide synthetase LanM [Krasilnikovia cinnamomea]|nr:type 2 lanthipeptide synthetase LanM [Krasilnikovia cinnamomea]